MRVCGRARVCEVQLPIVVECATQRDAPTTHPRRTRDAQRAVHKKEGTQYVVKCFNMMVEANRHMLIEEVKLMMAMNCDLIVRFKGAFLDDCKVRI